VTQWFFCALGELIEITGSIDGVKTALMSASASQLPSRARGGGWPRPPDRHRKPAGRCYLA